MYQSVNYVIKLNKKKKKRITTDLQTMAIIITARGSLKLLSLLFLYVLI